jgi:dTDP-4-dehydrorhamnose reductase
MRILLFGNTGQLGWELARTLSPLGNLTACDYPEVDLAEIKSIRRVFRDCQPDVLINAAAYTAVDRAEAEPERLNPLILLHLRSWRKKHRTLALLSSISQPTMSLMD